MILIVRLPLPAVSNGGSCVYTTWIGCFPIIHELADPCHPTTGRFIAASQHAVRSVIPIFLGQCNGFVHQVFVNRLSVTQSRTVVRPARSFRLQIETDQIGSDESCFRRTEGVEAHVIQAIVTTNAEHPFPRSYIHRRIACQWEVTVFHRTAKHRFATIYIEPFPFYLEITHTELYLSRVSLLAVGQFCRQFIKCRPEFIPRQKLFSHRKFHFHRIISRTDVETLMYGSHFVLNVRVKALGGKGDLSLGGRSRLYIHANQRFLIAQIGIYLNVF